LGYLFIVPVRADLSWMDAIFVIPDVQLHIVDAPLGAGPE
jgi:hypothetical protein